MAELLVELLSEEIPARLQTRAASDFETLAGRALEEAELAFEAIETYATPRRLTLHVRGLAEKPKPRWSWAMTLKDCAK